MGGLFYDDLNQGVLNLFNFTQAVGNGFLDAYVPIVEKRKDHSWGERGVNSNYIVVVVMSNSIWYGTEVHYLAYKVEAEQNQF